VSGGGRLVLDNVGVDIYLITRLLCNNFEETAMPSNAVATITKMMESLPESEQERVVDHVRDYLDNLLEEAQWDKAVKKTRGKLEAAARSVRREIAEGRAEKMDFDRL
jgi:hypothetical protein